MITSRRDCHYIFEGKVQNLSSLFDAIFLINNQSRQKTKEIVNVTEVLISDLISLDFTILYLRLLLIISFSFD